MLNFSAASTAGGLYHERLLDRRLAALAPQTWGILSLEVDQGALAAGELRVSRFVGILPDGLYLDFAAGDPEAPAARPIGTHFAPSQPVLEVFLACAQGARRGSQRRGRGQCARG